MKSDPGFKYIEDQIKDVVNEMNESTKDYNNDISSKNEEIKKAKKHLYNYLGVEQYEIIQKASINNDNTFYYADIHWMFYKL